MLVFYTVTDDEFLKEVCKRLAEAGPAELPCPPLRLKPASIRVFPPALESTLEPLSDEALKALLGVNSEE